MKIFLEKKNTLIFLFSPSFQKLSSFCFARQRVDEMSANALNLDKPKSLSSVNPFLHNDTFWSPLETVFLKTLWEKEKLLVTSNFSFSHSVFYLFG